MDYQVIVVGGGPVGLWTAYELQARGIRVLLVEANETTTRHPKMDVTNGRSMELFRRFGMADAIRDVAVPRENPMDVSWVTRLGEWELARFPYPNVNDWSATIREKNDGSQALEPNMRLSQIVLEPFLRDQLVTKELVELRFGWAGVDFVDKGDSVDVTLRNSSTGEEEVLNCGLLAGCDGGSSIIREKLGFKLEGDFNCARFFMVHFKSQDHDILQKFGIAWHYQSPAGATLIAQDDNQSWTIHVMLPPGTDEASVDPRELVFDALGARFDLEVLQANPWSPHLVVSNGYGKGRVWLAGDSTHQVIPTGGYGMNTGIGDATDLAWKYAAFLQGWGGEKLLESIAAERRPVGVGIVEGARRNMGVRLKIAEAYDPVVHEDTTEGAAARDRLGKLILELGNAENESLGIELGYRYRDSAIVCHEGNEPEWELTEYIPSTWPGVRPPSVFLENGSALFDEFGLWFTLVRFSDTPVEDFLDAAQSLGVPLKLLDLREEKVRRLYERDLVLIRPDQHVAWRGEAAPANCEEVIRKVIGETP